MVPEGSQCDSKWLGQLCYALVTSIQMLVGNGLVK